MDSQFKIGSLGNSEKLFELILVIKRTFKYLFLWFIDSICNIADEIASFERVLKGRSNGAVVVAKGIVGYSMSLFFTVKGFDVFRLNPA